MSSLRLTILVEDHSNGSGLVPEHGLAIWLETGQRRFLFDTGQGGALRPNAARLGIDLTATDSIILSHGHYDHAGGIVSGLECGRRTWVYAHRAAFEPKFSPGPGSQPRANGMGVAQQKLIRRCGEFIPTNQPVDVGRGLHLTGPVPRVNDFEDTGGAFFKDPECSVPDEMIDDQAAFVDTSAGTVVVLGCAHAGVINTLRYVRELTAGRPILAVVGGTHLINATAERLRRTMAALQELSPGAIYPCHCTGAAGLTSLRQAFPERFHACHAGTTIEFDA